MSLYPVVYGNMMSRVSIATCTCTRTSVEDTVRTNTWSQKLRRRTNHSFFHAMLETDGLAGSSRMKCSNARDQAARYGEPLAEDEEEEDDGDEADEDEEELPAPAALRLATGCFERARASPAAEEAEAAAVVEELGAAAPLLLATAWEPTAPPLWFE